jgi:hypothetical protein
VKQTNRDTKEVDTNQAKEFRARFKPASEGVSAQRRDEIVGILDGVQQVSLEANQIEIALDFGRGIGPVHLRMIDTTRLEQEEGAEQGAG